MTKSSEGRKPSMDALVAWLGAFADAYSLDRAKIAKELAGPSELAALIRAMVEVERPAGKVGRPNKSSRKWRIAQEIRIARSVMGLTKDAAIERVIEDWSAREGEELKFETVKRYYDEARGLWPEISDENVSLADLYFVRPL